VRERQRRECVYLAHSHEEHMGAARDVGVIVGHEPRNDIAYQIHSLLVHQSPDKDQQRDCILLLLLLMRCRKEP